MLIEIALCNDRETPPTIPVSEWLFQTKLHVDAGGAAVFLPVRDVLEQDWPEHDEEMRRLHLQYRNRLEFADRPHLLGGLDRHAGRTAGDGGVDDVAAGRGDPADPGPSRSTGALLCMDALAQASPDEVRAGLDAAGRRLRDVARRNRQRRPRSCRRICGRLADEVVEEARAAHGRLLTGLAHVVDDPEALRCFQFMNAVMRDQRVHSQIAALRNSDPTLSYADAQRQVEDAEAGAAVGVAAVPAGVHPDAARGADRPHGRYAQWPAGAGRAAVLPDRWRQDRGVPGPGRVHVRDPPPATSIVSRPTVRWTARDGVAVLMRYTLRLLTAQQFQRATALVCAAELVRRQDEADLGHGAVPDRAVGRHRREPEAVGGGRRAAAARPTIYGGYRLTVLQVQRCPWCGSPITAANVRADEGEPAGAGVLRRRPGPLPVRQGRRGHRGSAGADGG